LRFGAFLGAALLHLVPIFLKFGLPELGVALRFGGHALVERQCREACHQRTHQLGPRGVTIVGGNLND
jgi:hypothetical protein